MRIDSRRFRAIFENVTQDGRTSSGGLSRPALSAPHLAARQRFSRIMASHGLDVQTDGAGNVSAVWRAGNEGAPTLALGSHLDSVPDGGRFDGALGVAAAAEVVLGLRHRGVTPAVNLEVIDFTDEEGTWVSLMGSRAVSGQLTAEDLRRPRGNPEAFEKALERAGLTKTGILGASRVGEDFSAYLELHIEQGTRLENSGTDIGIVTGMVGIHMYLVSFVGSPNHAGTTPMDQRRDAALGASAFALKVHEIALQQFPGRVATVGNMKFSPGSFNVVAGRVTCFVEFRAGDHGEAAAMEAALREAARQSAKSFNLVWEFVLLESVKARQMDENIQHAFRRAASRFGISTRLLPSMAGHDAQNMALLAPAGLAFVPSVGGYSHSPREFTRWEDCEQGCRLMLATTCSLLGLSD